MLPASSTACDWKIANAIVRIPAISDSVDLRPANIAGRADVRHKRNAVDPRAGLSGHTARARRIGGGGAGIARAATEPAAGSAAGTGCAARVAYAETTLAAGCRCAETAGTGRAAVITSTTAAAIAANRV